MNKINNQRFLWRLLKILFIIKVYNIQDAIDMNVVWGSSVCTDHVLNWLRWCVCCLYTGLTVLKLPKLPSAECWLDTQWCFERVCTLACDSRVVCVSCAICSLSSDISFLQQKSLHCTWMIYIYIDIVLKWIKYIG